MFVNHITDDSWPWKSTDALSKQTYDFNHEVRVAESSDANFATNSKSHSMDFDSHLEASVVGGLIEDYNGASYFLDDRPKPSQITVTFAWTGKTKEEYYEDLRAQDFQSLRDGGEQSMLEATHLVVSVFYGAQAYCVFTRDLNGKGEDEDTRNEAQEHLSKMVEMFLKKLDHTNFKKQLSKTEKHQFASLKCRLYLDLQTEPVRECNIFDAYQHILELKGHLFKNPNKVREMKIVPIAVQICPLHVLLVSAGGSVSRRFQYRDVESRLVKKCSRIIADLKRISIKAEILSNANKENDCAALLTFASTVSKYREVLKTTLKKSIIAARTSNDSCVNTTAKDGENHPLFKFSHLEQWLTFKQAEFEMMSLMVSGAGTAIFLANKNQLRKQLSSDKKYALVLFVPPIDDQTNSVLKTMEKCCDKLRGNGEIKDDRSPWHSIQSKRTFVLEFIRELASHTEKNQQLSDVQWIVTFGESGGKFACSYSIYQADKLLKNNLRRLPDAPTGLRMHLPITRRVKKAKTTSSSISVEWVMKT